MSTGESKVRSDLVAKASASNLSSNEAVLEAISQGADLVHFGFGESPFPIPPRVVAALQEHAGRKEYGPVRGIPSLRDGITGFHTAHASTGPAGLDPSLVVVGPGSKELIFLSMLTSAEGTTVVLPGPSWLTYGPQAALAGRRARIVRNTQENGWKLCPRALDQALGGGDPGAGGDDGKFEDEVDGGDDVEDGKDASVKALVVLTSPCNPTGAVYSAEELKAIAEVVRKRDAVVFSDEIYGPLTWGAPECAGENTYPTISSFIPERTIVAGGLSKWGAAGGWRVGWAIFPPALKSWYAAVVAAASHTYTACASPIQHAAAAYFSPDQAHREEIEEFVSRQNQLLRCAARWCTRTLRAAGIACTLPQGAYYLWPNFEPLRSRLERRGLRTIEAVVEAIRGEAGVVVLPSTDFQVPGGHTWTARLCFASPIRGRQALDRAREFPRGEDLPESVLQEIAPDMIKGIERIAAWAKGLPE